jgi:hypothetical protein
MPNTRRIVGCSFHAWLLRKPRPEGPVGGRRSNAANSSLPSISRDVCPRLCGALPAPSGYATATAQSSSAPGA